MKVLVLASQKGGAGKTTLAAHLAVAASQDGAGPAVLIDTDPQGSLSAWWNSREADTPALASATLAELPVKLAALAEAGFALAVIDTPPAITAAIRDVVKLADLVLIPTRPSPHDLRAVGSTVDIAQEAGRPFAFAVTQAKANARLTVQAVAALSAHGAVARRSCMTAWITRPRWWTGAPSRRRTLRAAVPRKSTNYLLSCKNA